MIPSGAAISAVAIGEHSVSWAVTAFVQSLLEAGVASGSIGDYVLRAATAYVVDEDGIPYLSTLRQNFTFERSLLSGDAFSGMNISLGRIELDNHEALYDADVADYSVDGEIITIKVGEVVDGRADVASWYTVGEFIGARHHANETTLTIDLRDKTSLFEVPARKSAAYLGTGNMEGGPEVAGKNRPWALGWVTGATGAPLLPAELIDQVNDGVCNITDCYDGGVAYTFSADYATLALLRAATLVPGQFATCNALGLARRGGVPFGAVTYDLQGYDVDGNAIETTAEIMREVIVEATEISSDEIADNTFDLVDIQQGAARGYYLAYDQDVTVAQFAAKWMRGVGGYVGTDRLGMIEIAIVDAPSLAPIAYYDATQFLDITREPLPDAYYPPPQKVRVSWAHNWTPLTTVFGDEIADAERMAYLREPYKVASTSDDDAALVLASYPNAKVPDVIEGYFKLEDDALEEAERQFDFRTGARILYRGTIPLHPFVHDLGETIHVTRPRFELADGKPLLLLSVRDVIDTRSQDVVGLV